MQSLHKSAFSGADNTRTHAATKTKVDHLTLRGMRQYSSEVYIYYITSILSLQWQQKVNPP